MNLSELFGKKLKEIRISKNLTQQELAELCEMHTTSIGMIEIGKRTPSLATVKKIAEKLELDYAELFNFKEIYNQNKTSEKLHKELQKELTNIDCNILKYLIHHIREIKKTFLQH